MKATLANMPSPPMRDIVWRIISRGGWKTPQEIQSAILSDYGRWTSDAAVTARLRDLRKVRYGAYHIKCRPRKEKSAWEYKLMKD